MRQTRSPPGAARKTFALWRDPRLDAGALAAALAHERGADLAGRPEHRRAALRPIMTEHTKLLAQQIRPTARLNGSPCLTCWPTCFMGTTRKPRCSPSYLHSATGKVCVAGDCLAPGPAKAEAPALRNAHRPGSRWCSWPTGSTATPRCDWPRSGDAPGHRQPGGSRSGWPKAWRSA